MFQRVGNQAISYEFVDLLFSKLSSCCSITVQDHTLWCEYDKLVDHVLCFPALSLYVNESRSVEILKVDFFNSDIKCRPVSNTIITAAIAHNYNTKARWPMV